MAFLDGNQPERLCAPMAEHIKRKGGEVRTSSPVKRIVTNDDGSVKHLEMRDGSTIEADEYVSAMPVDIVTPLPSLPRTHSFRPRDHLVCCRCMSALMDASLTVPYAVIVDLSKQAEPVDASKSQRLLVHSNGLTGAAVRA